ncbi:MULTISPECIES: DUF423 domain-containing protein [unclassified Marinobacter]|uniref:DUF423 domain-containing protein n=1 Tax=unclassified Marinobacter TaxID=83889 RepID=UPI001902EB99|nr:MULTISPECIES: DUF423 domain-containing protein [unclassified Marinobacter]MBK1850766.1 DUF423 domain-containing protein [Marinobacter sp. 1-4A]MCK0163375.1 DUF423 domain-containing protein [Marinobacter sp. S6332]
MRLPIITGAFFAVTAVMAGAFGAHGLRNIVSERSLEVFQTAVTYQMYHAIALVLVALLSGFGLSRRRLSLAAGFFSLGILLFSGSLYTLVLTDIRWVGPITPLGGICFMIGWALLLTVGLRQNGTQNRG